MQYFKDKKTVSFSYKEPLLKNEAKYLEVDNKIETDSESESEPEFDNELTRRERMATWRCSIL